MTAANTTDQLMLGIETSCDETAAAVVRDGHEILASTVASQDELHARFGGVVPEIASRKHCETITAVVENVLQQAQVNWDDLAGIAVTNGPGLVGSLLVGVSAAKGYALARKLPLVAVNHIEAHLFANFLHRPGRQPPADPNLSPTICLIASGGHTDLVFVRSLGDYAIAGWTRDDAAGEALDKAARVLGLGYPGGPAIERTAANGDPAAIDFPRPQIDNTYDFSFSGLKTALLRYMKDIGGDITDLEDGRVADIAAGFQEAVVDCLVRNTTQAAADYRVRQVLLAGGVAANSRLRNKIQHWGRQMAVPVAFPPLNLCTDNAAMVAAAGYFRARETGWNTLDIDVFSALPVADHIAYNDQ